MQFSNALANVESFAHFCRSKLLPPARLTLSEAAAAALAGDEYLAEDDDDYGSEGKGSDEDGNRVEIFLDSSSTSPQSTVTQLTVTQLTGRKLHSYKGNNVKEIKETGTYRKQEFYYFADYNCNKLVCFAICILVYICLNFL